MLLIRFFEENVSIHTRNLECFNMSKSVFSRQQFNNILRIMAGYPAIILNIKSWRKNYMRIYCTQKGWIYIWTYICSRIFTLSKKSKIPTVIMPCSSVRGLISSFTTIIFLNESFNLVRDFFSCTIFSGDAISNADCI